MTPDPAAFAADWIEAWNSHDLERILSHYAEDVVFESPIIRERLGEPSGRVVGKAALRAYWSGAPTSLRFDLLAVFPGVDAIALRYFSHHRGCEAVEVMRFGPDGLIVAGAAHYNDLASDHLKPCERHTPPLPGLP